MYIIYMKYEFVYFYFFMRKILLKFFFIYLPKDEGLHIKRIYREGVHIHTYTGMHKYTYLPSGHVPIRVCTFMCMDV